MFFLNKTDIPSDYKDPSKWDWVPEPVWEMFTTEKSLPHGQK
jgi:hypothetical protein